MGSYLGDGSHAALSESKLINGDTVGSAEHRDNILNGDFSEIEVGARTGETYDARNA